LGGRPRRKCGRGGKCASKQPNIAKAVFRACAGAAFCTAPMSAATFAKDANMRESYMRAVSVMSGPKIKRGRVDADDTLKVADITGAKRNMSGRAMQIVNQIAGSSWMKGLLRRGTFQRAQVVEYARFLVLKALTGDVVLPLQHSPSGPVDVVWHAHMLMPQEYIKMSYDLFGEGVVLEHEPTPEGDEQQVARLTFTLTLYKSVFGDPPQAFWPQEEKQVQSDTTVSVRFLAGRIIQIKVDDATTVEELRSKIQDREGTPPGLQTLLHGGKRLPADKDKESSETLKSFGIENGDTVYLLVNLRGC